MKIIKLIAYTVSLSVAVTAIAAVLDTVSAGKKQNSSVAVMANSDGDGFTELTDTMMSLSELIESCTALMPPSLGKPVRSVLNGVRNSAEGLTASLLRFIYRS